MHCATFRAEDGSKRPIPSPFLKSHGVHADYETVGSVREFAVFVGVGNVSQNGCPIASAVRLQILNSCPMWGADPDKPSVFQVIESPFEIANRKLRVLLDSATVVPCELENQIVQSASEVVCDLSNQDSKDVIDDGNVRTGREIVGRLTLILDDQGIVVEFAEAGLPLFEILDVLYCPIDPVERVLEWMRHREQSNEAV
jgi:hypothetical protein